MVGIKHRQRYIKWYHLARKVIADEKITPNLTDTRILGLVSAANWLPIASPDLIYGRNKVKTSHFPNIYTVLHSEEPRMSVGLVFNTVGSIDGTRKSILTPYSKEEKFELVRLLHELDDNYKTKVFRKIRPDYRQTPEYDDAGCFAIQTNMINEESIEQMFNCVNRIREEGSANRERLIALGKAKKSYTETPIIDLAVIEIPLDEDEYKKRIKELIGPYKACLAIKPPAEIRRRIKKDAKEVSELKREKERLDLISEIPQHPQHREAIKRLEEVNKRLKELETRGTAE